MRLCHLSKTKWNTEVNYCKKAWQRCRAYPHYTIIFRRKQVKKIILMLLVLLLTLPAFSGMVLAETKAEDEYPVRFDLRDYGVVTPVKSQNPWGSCWSFGGIAAAESSILTTLGMTNEEFKELTGEDFDLSEKHLLWFATHPITEQTSSSQAGEGILTITEETDPNAVYDDGGTFILTTTLFSSGVGPVFENAFPYKGAEGLTDKQFFEKYPEKAAAAARALVESGEGMTVEELVARAHDEPERAEGLIAILLENGWMKESVSVDELTVEVLDEAFVNMYMQILEMMGSDDFSRADDWSIPYVDENGRSNRDLYAGFTLVDGNILPGLRILDSEGKWTGINDAGMLAVKSELLKGRAVSAAFKSDKSMPGEPENTDGFMNLETWAHYTHQDVPQSHAITIIGWDDNYAKENFKANHMPPADGAWLVKNSWGSETDYYTLPDGTPVNYMQWGIVNDEGKHTGYFYISYYDKTLDFPESMVFDADLMIEGTQMGVWMYDYMPSIEIEGIKEGSAEIKDQGTEVLKTANVFLNDSGSDVRLYGVSTKTASPRARVVYSVYKLNEDAADPEDGEFLGRKVAYYDYAGFHRQQLRGELTIRDGEKIAIVVEESVVGNDGEKLYEYAVNMAPSRKYAEATDNTKYGVSVVNKGESFIYEDGQWKDWADELAEANTSVAEEKGVELSDILSVDNFSIKAYVVRDAE